MKKWFAWGILVAAFVLVFFHRLSLGAVSDLMGGELGLTGYEMSKVAAMTFYGYAIMQIPVGILVDAVGVRKICFLGMGVTALGSFILGVSGSMIICCIARFFVGVGTSVIIVSIMKIQATMFPENMYSTMSGITSCLGNLGALLATYPLALAAGILGWRGSFKLLGLATFVIAIGILFLVKENKGQDSPQIEEENESKGNVLKGVVHVIRNKYTWPNFFIMMFFVGSMTAILGLWGTAFLKDTYGISIKEASYYISFIIYGYIIGSPIVGKLSDMMNGNVKKIILPSSIGYSAMWFYFLVIRGGKPRKEMLPVIFFIMGIFMISHILAFSNVKRVNDIKYVGIATALVNTGEFIGGGIISMLIGALVERGLSIGSGMKVILISSVLSVIAAVFIKEKSELAIAVEKI